MLWYELQTLGTSLLLAQLRVPACNLTFTGLTSESHFPPIEGRHGRAFLFSHAMNVEAGPKEDRPLMTGLHTVADIFCGDCRQVLGWKYLRAYESSQKYKEGKFIFEKSKIVKEDW
ncbi:hypothetical protein KSS87_015967 [Heliosperma pusillum]|nr:hypothetical protein KSS87_015967 [Heliosperma pusillum]